METCKLRCGGGIDAGNIGSVRAAGAAAAAVISAIAGADDPIAATRYLVDRFEASWWRLADDFNRQAPTLATLG